MGCRQSDHKSIEQLIILKLNLYQMGASIIRVPIMSLDSSAQIGRPWAQSYLCKPCIHKQQNFRSPALLMEARKCYVT